MEPTPSNKPSVEILQQETYLALIKNSLDSHLWKEMYASVNGIRQDIMRNGDLSCAFFVSSILKLCDLVPQLSVTVHGLVKQLETLGWPQVSETTPGDILIWETIIDERGEKHSHVGFFIGDDQAISNNAKLGCPQEHHWTFDDSRKVTAIYRPQWEAPRS